jgi:predicted GIY-YIG superfamily endonuclease
MIYIYLLRDPFTKKPRYVGLSRKPQERLVQHCYMRGPNRHLNSWIRNLKLKDSRPALEILYRADSEELANRMERYFIRVYKKDFPEIVNLTTGGEGGFRYTGPKYVYSSEQLRRKSEQQKAVMTPERRERMSRLFKGRKNPNPKGFISINIARTGIPLSKEHRAKISAANKGRKQTVENIEKFRLRSIEMWKDEDYRKRMSNMNKPILDKYRETALQKARDLKTARRIASKQRVKEALEREVRSARVIASELGISKTYAQKLINEIKADRQACTISLNVV